MKFLKRKMPYSPDPECQKCGHNQFRWRFRFIFRDLMLRCKRCKFRNRMANR